MNIVCLLSGGIDSVVLLFRLKKSNHDIIPLFINYGQKSFKKELESATTACQMLDLDLEKIDVSGLSSIPSGLTNSDYSPIDYPLFPARNMVLLSIAASFAVSKSIQIIGIGVLGDSNFPDQTKAFLDAAELALSSSIGTNMKILAPLSTLNKLEVVRLAKENDIPLAFTYSCYSGSEKPCNECLSCKDRQQSFQLEGILDNP